MLWWMLLILLVKWQADCSWLTGVRGWRSEEVIVSRRQKAIERKV